MSLLKRATLVQKLILSYAAMTVFTIAALGNAIMGLYALNRITGTIVSSDLVAITTVGKLRDSLLAQEGYVRKFIILNGSEFKNLFLNHEQEFQTSLNRLKGSGPDRRLPELSQNYRTFRDGALVLFEGGAIDQKVITTAADRTLAALDGIGLVTIPVNQRQGTRRAPHNHDPEICLAGLGPRVKQWLEWFGDCPQSQDARQHKGQAGNKLP